MSRLPIKLFVGLFVAALLLSTLAGCEKDDTDPPDGMSGMTALVDNATGCQYLSVYRGGITPRLDADGKTHRGCKDAKP